MRFNGKKKFAASHVQIECAVLASRKQYFRPPLLKKVNHMCCHVLSCAADAVNVSESEYLKFELCRHLCNKCRLQNQPLYRPLYQPKKIGACYIMLRRHSLQPRRWLQSI